MRFLSLSGFGTVCAPYLELLLLNQPWFGQTVPSPRLLKHQHCSVLSQTAQEAGFDGYVHETHGERVTSGAAEE